MDSSTWHWIAGGIVSAVSGLGGLIWKDHKKKVSCIEKKVNETPIHYVPRTECNRIREEEIASLKELADDMKDGFRTVFIKIDSITANFDAKHEKLRDLIEERSRRRE